jgi:hypothetical protein
MDHRRPLPSAALLERYPLATKRRLYFTRVRPVAPYPIRVEWDEDGWHWSADGGCGRVELPRDVPRGELEEAVDMAALEMGCREQDVEAAVFEVSP